MGTEGVEAASAVLPWKWKWKWKRRGTPSTTGPFRFIPGKTRENRHLLHYLPSVPPPNEYIFIPIHIYIYLQARGAERTPRIARVFVPI